MKQTKLRKQTKAVLFAGAAAFAALVPQSHAQSGDALVDKLEQKGILSADEAKQLREENQRDFNNSLTNRITPAFAKMTGMPDWVTGYKLSGDFRGRMDWQTTDASTLADRIRLRYRLRVGLAVQMKDNMEVGFRLGSGDGGPLSNNQTMAGNASKKAIYIDTAYGKWTAIKNDDLVLSATIGKMNQPFTFSSMVFDPDYTPEGGALESTYKLTDTQSIRFVGGGFILDESSTKSRDPFMYGGQLTLNSQWAPAFATALGVGVLDIVNKETLLATYDSNIGNARTGGVLVNHYNPVIADASATYTLENFPLYPTKFPITVSGEYINNPGADHNNEGYWAGVTFGKSGKKGTWDIGYRYEYLEADAWWDQTVDDDFIAYNGGIVAGTNIKGHLVKATYSLTDSLSLGFTCYIDQLIHPPTPTAKSDAMHFMADLLWKF